MRVYIRLTDAEIDRLCELAHRERRDPRSQASYLLSRALGMTGALDEKPPKGAASRRKRGGDTNVYAN